MSIQEIVAAQKSFFETGKTLDLSYRMNALKALYAAVTANEKKLTEALNADLGKCSCEAYITEIGLARDEMRFLMKGLPRWIRPRTVRTPITNFAAHSFVWPEPYGSALVISPWNYPVLLSIDPVAGAIAAGNTVVLKPSNYSKATSQVLAELFAGIFPPEYVAVVLGGRAENTDLLEQKFDYIFFTGSVDVGRAVMSAAAKHLTPVSLELGGKSPVIVDETADIALTGKRLAFGKLLNAGQTCVAPDHVYVHASKKDALIGALRSAIAEFYPGGIDDAGLPHIISDKHFERVARLLEGENAVIGGQTDKARLRIAPTVLDGVTAASPVMGEEIFGPVLPLISYTDVEEVLRAIRSRPKPLALYLFSQNKALQKRVVKEISFGGGCVNDTVVHLATPHMGFGGVGESGMGAYHGKLSFDTFTHYKSIVDKKTWIDMKVRYAPFTPDKEKLLRMLMK